ncbi:MAG: sigma-70 family RNA polymerase sigma factor [Myxococcales bacterium]|nr:sigma-70 family RNA polymerase sigma factor [Myxococcales bacterium]MDH3844111.1 sigma-70 family RNA polymerase sigma factor [Myxococcales bacterium]
MAEARPNDPADLVAAMAAGDSGQPLSAFYAQYGSTVLALLTKMLGSPAEAEEILQEVFVELWRRAAEYDSSRGSVVAWVVTVARSRALDALRKRSRRYGDRQLQFSERHALETERGRPDVLVSNTRWHQALRQAFATLDADQRAVLELSYFLGMSHGQIAETLNLPVGTVKSRILAGMRALRAMLPIIHQSMRA